MEIERLETGRRMSQLVAYGDLVWLAGQCGTANKSIGDQTAEALQKIDMNLAKVGSDKSRILNATIWLANIADYDEMNKVWDNWIPEGSAPARACGEAKLGGNGYNVEIICVAAKANLVNRSCP